MFTDEFIAAAARSPKIAKSFHIPLQSASDRILDAMGRPYRMQYIRTLLDRLLDAIPDAGVGMDVIAGFPGEDAQCFEETRDFLNSAGIYYLHVFPFSPRPGTRAALMDGAVPEKEKKVRVKELKLVDAKKARGLSRALRRNSGIDNPREQTLPRTVHARLYRELYSCSHPLRRACVRTGPP